MERPQSSWVSRTNVVKIISITERNIQSQHKISIKKIQQHFHRVRKNLKFIWKCKRFQISKIIITGKNLSFHNPGSQIIPQSHSHQNNMVLAQKRGTE